MQFWISVTSKDHVLAGMTGGYIQAHGDKAGQLHLLDRDDVIFFYSPGTLFRRGEILQAFTAVARVTDEKPQAVAMSGQAKTLGKPQPWRRTLSPLPCDEAPALGLVPELEFITDKENWATAMGRSLFAIGEADARRIAAAMHASLT